MSEKIYNVTNRSSSLVFYSIPENHIQRQFGAGETKKIPHDELLALTYQAGGPALIRNYLFIAEPEGVVEFNGATEPEYYLDAAGVKNLILTGSLDEFLDCLDFAPEGVIDLVKKLAVDLPMTDMQKAEALKKKTGFDVIKAVANNRADKEDNDKELEVAKERRVKPATEAAETGRRTSGDKYKIISE